MLNILYLILFIHEFIYWDFFFILLFFYFLFFTFNHFFPLLLWFIEFFFFPFPGMGQYILIMNVSINYISTITYHHELSFVLFINFFLPVYKLKWYLDKTNKDWNHTVLYNLVVRFRHLVLFWMLVPLQNFFPTT